MAIQRVPWVDDDGSGQTGTIINNAWLTSLYNQIDAALGGGALIETSGSYTPIDKSGAGLTLASATGTWKRIGSFVFVYIALRWPTTSDGSGGKVSLPVAATIVSGLNPVYSELVNAQYVLQVSGPDFALFKPPGAVPVTNAMLSGLAVSAAGVYIA